MGEPSLVTGSKLVIRVLTEDMECIVRGRIIIDPQGTSSEDNLEKIIFESVPD